VNLRAVVFIAALGVCSLNAASVLASDPSTASSAARAMPSFSAPEQEVRAAAAAIVSAFGRNDRTA